MNHEYSLFLGTLKIGNVTQADSDFPSLWGRIEFENSIAVPETDAARRMARFIELSRHYTRLLETLVEGQESSEQDTINAELEGYADFIDSDDWHLVDEHGERVPILVPIFHDHDEIVWRWNPAAP